MIEFNASARDELIARIGSLAARWQDAVQLHDELAGEAQDLGRAERHCLALLWDGSRSPSEIASAVRLSPSSVTALIDRLEQRGLAERSHGGADRRRISVSMTSAARSAAEAAYGPLAKAGRELLQRYSDEELKTVERFLEDAIQVQRAATEAFAPPRK